MATSWQRHQQGACYLTGILHADDFGRAQKGVVAPAPRKPPLMDANGREENEIN